MALAKKCDRCGKFYEEYNTKNDGKNINGILLLNIDCHEKYYTHGPIDLCPDCKDSFKEWLTNKKAAAVSLYEMYKRSKNKNVEVKEDI